MNELHILGSCGEEPDEDKACDLLQYVLTIKEVDWNSEKLMKASWRKQIMDIIVKIYQKGMQTSLKYILLSTQIN